MDYRSIILDVDGVIFDSNQIKERNIGRVAEKFLKGLELQEFLRFFVSGNGIPRETKIAKYFGENTSEYFKVLDSYNKLNKETLYRAPLASGVRNFLKNYSDTLNIWAISGGAETEIKKLFRLNDLTRYFQGIYGGPVQKKEHLARINPDRPICYIGDSKVDHLTAMAFDANFIFMSRYTQFENWQEYFKNYPEVKIITDFTAISFNSTNK